MDEAYKQMGVHIFMLVGYRNSNGDVVKAKYVNNAYHVKLVSSQSPRVETDTFTPSNTNFTPIFTKVGGDVWNQWDKHLQGQIDTGMQKSSINMDLLLIHLHLKMMMTISPPVNW